MQAALTSAVSFAIGAVLPLAIALAAPASQLTVWVAGGSLASLGALGALAARTGGAGASRATVRVMGWGALAMTATAIVGRVFGAAV